MYRADAPDDEQKIERLERELNLAYHTQNAGDDGSEISLALLRFRAKRLAKDVAALRARHAPEPLSTRLANQVRRATKHRLAMGFVAGVGAVSLAWGVRAELLTGTAVEEVAELDMIETAPPSTVDPPAALDTIAGPLASNEPAATAPDGSADADPETPTPHVALSAQDYQKLLERSRSFFHAIEERDGSALAALVHPLGLLSMKEEGITLARGALRRCFSSRSTERVFVTAASDETVNKTCGDILAAYVETPYERSRDVTFNEEPNAPGLSMPRPTTGPRSPFVFFYLPSPRGDLLWQGAELVFDRYGDDFVLTAVHKLYWTP